MDAVQQRERDKIIQEWRGAVSTHDLEKEKSGLCIMIACTVTRLCHTKGHVLRRSVIGPNRLMGALGDDSEERLRWQEKRRAPEKRPNNCGSSCGCLGKWRRDAKPTYARFIRPYEAWKNSSRMSQGECQLQGWRSKCQEIK